MQRKENESACDPFLLRSSCSITEVFVAPGGEKALVLVHCLLVGANADDCIDDGRRIGRTTFAVWLRVFAAILGPKQRQFQSFQNSTNWPNFGPIRAKIGTSTHYVVVLQMVILLDTCGNVPVLERWLAVGRDGPCSWNEPCIVHNTLYWVWLWTGWLTLW